MNQEIPLTVSKRENKGTGKSREHRRSKKVPGIIYGEKKDLTLGAVEVPIEKQISIDKASTKGLKSQEYKNTTESKVDKLRKLRRGN